MSSADHDCALKNGFGELSYRMPCPNHASFRLWPVAGSDSWWAYKEVDLDHHPLIGLITLLAGDAEKFPQVLGLESFSPFQRVSK